MGRRPKRPKRNVFGEVINATGDGIVGAFSRGWKSGGPKKGPRAKATSSGRNSRNSGYRNPSEGSRGGHRPTFTSYSAPYVSVGDPSNSPIPAVSSEPKGKSGGSIAAVLSALVILVAVILAVIIYRNSGNAGPNPPPLPPDSETLAATGYVASIDGRVTGVRFYASSGEAIASDSRSYSETFEFDAARSIWWELNLQNPAHPARKDLLIVVYLYNPDGTLRQIQQSPSYLEPSWTSSAHSNQWSQEVGGWTPGTYRVSFFIDRVKIAAGYFTIAAPSSPPPPATETSPESTTHESPLPSEEAPQSNAPPPKPPTIEDCNLERRLTAQPTLDDKEKLKLDEVKGSCGAMNLSLQSEPPNPPQISTASEWRRFEDAPHTPPRAPSAESSSVVEAHLLKQVSPVYPPLAKQARVQGLVRLSATVGVDGKLHDVRVVSGNPLLSGAALNAVQRWTYSPARLHETPVESQVTIEVNFKMN
jgi:protein TonB